MPCDRCSNPTVTYQSQRLVPREEGTWESEHLHLCAVCAEAEEAHVSAMQADVERRIADGSLIEQVRADLGPALASGDPAQVAQAAEFLALIATALPEGLPPDLHQVVVRFQRATLGDVPAAE